MIEYIIKIKRKTKSLLRDPWVWRMAWRDGRHNASRLFLFIASMITGIAAVVAISSLNYSMQQELNRNAKELLGADLVIKSNKKFDSTFTALLDSAAVRQAPNADMASMVMFMNTGQSRLVKLTALEGDFPFYGDLITLPDDSYAKVRTGRYAMLDESLATQYEVSSDDSIKVGSSVFRVAGVVRKIPGGGELTSTIAPVVYIAFSELDSTGLVQYGSRVNYNLFIKTKTEQETTDLLKRLRPEMKQRGYSFDTVEERKNDLGNGFRSVYRFFLLLAFVALVLGCIGVASSVHIYAREKRDEVAILRCVGSSGWQAFNIYFIQVFALGLAGSVLGAAFGVGLQQLIPLAFGELLPVELKFNVQWIAVGEGLILGVLISVLFTVLPLVAVRFVPPLSVLRTDFNAERVISKTKIVTLFLIVLFPVLAAAYQTRSFLAGSLFTGGLAMALGALTAVAAVLLWMIKRYFPRRASFIWRHGMANLFRPNNQTRIMLVTIGLGAFIISTLNIIQSSLLNQVEFTGNSNQSNTILFDIQSSQREGVLNLMDQYQLPRNQVVPIITCRLASVKGVPVEQIQKDTSLRIPNWALTREYRVTYRDSLHLSEELVKGKIQWRGGGVVDSVGVTISDGMQETLRLDVGDSLVFDVQGVPIRTFISGIRKVDWPKDPPNFIFVFPTGVLEGAPQIWVAATRITDTQNANRFQQELVMSYPNVSLIDLRLILSTIDELFGKVAVVVRFLALFSIITGLVVLAGAVLNSRFARVKENVLLRTVGARQRQIVRITLIEYGYLGLFAALTGMVLSLAAGWLLATFFFEIKFAVDVLELLAIAAGVMLLTVFIGWFNSRSVLNTPPLQVLRGEG